MLSVDVAACAETQRAASHTVKVSLTSLLSEHARDPRWWSGRAPDEGGWPSDDFRRRESGREPFELEGVSKRRGALRVERRRTCTQPTAWEMWPDMGGPSPRSKFPCCERPCSWAAKLKNRALFHRLGLPSVVMDSTPSPYPSWTVQPVFMGCLGCPSSWTAHPSSWVAVLKPTPC